MFAATGWGACPQALTASDAAGCSCLPPEGLRLAQSRPLFPVALTACLDICSPNNICHKSSPLTPGRLVGTTEPVTGGQACPMAAQGRILNCVFPWQQQHLPSGRGGLRTVSGAAVGAAPQLSSFCSNSHCCNSGLCEEKLFFKKISCILVYSRILTWSVLPDSE